MLPDIIAKYFSKRKINSRLLQVLFYSVVFHAILALILGGIVISNTIGLNDSDFEAPEAVEIEEPLPEVKIEIKPQKMQSAPLQMKTLAQIKVDDVDIDLPDISDTFTVSSGLGSVSGRGLNLGNIGMRFPDISGFGITEELKHSWKGTLYLFDPHGIVNLLDPEKRKVVGLREGKRKTKKVYIYDIFIPEQDFSDGFPGLTDQSEWFALDFEATIRWPAELAGNYEFSLQSDDGSVLFIDKKLVIDNDGMHAMIPVVGRHEMKAGERKLRLVYFQGPAFKLGLTLQYRKLGDYEWQNFDLKKFIKYQM